MSDYHYHEPTLIATSETFTLDDDPIEEFHVSIPSVNVDILDTKVPEDESDIPTEAFRAHIAVLEAQKGIRWLHHIKPGASRIYHIGNLALDRLVDKHADLLAKIFMFAAEHGLVLLVQKRYPCYTEYHAYRTACPTTDLHVTSLHHILKEFENG